MVDTASFPSARLPTALGSQEAGIRFSCAPSKSRVMRKVKVHMSHGFPRLSPLSNFAHFYSWMGLPILRGYFIHPAGANVKKHIHLCICERSQTNQRFIIIFIAATRLYVSTFVITRADLECFGNPPTC